MRDIALAVASVVIRGYVTMRLCKQCKCSIPNLNVCFYQIASPRKDQARKMPADVSYLFGISPPFHESFYSPVNAATSTAADAYWANTLGVFATQRLHPSPRMQRKAQVHSAVHPSQLLHHHADVRKVLRSQSQPVPIIKTSDRNARGRGKRVTFADSHGKSLTVVKYVKESSNEPPNLADSGHLVQLMEKKLSLNNRSSDKLFEKPKFVLKFKQPASDYIKFKERLNENNVCLENVILKEDRTISGTVKVKNLAFEKTVTLRLTCDNWQSHQDVACRFVKDAYSASTVDSFQFNVKFDALPGEKEAQAEFCLRYVAGGDREFWDNNDGMNYVIQVCGCSQLGTPAPTNSMTVRSGIASTYQELPGPQFNTWQEWEGSGPFY